MTLLFMAFIESGAQAVQPTGGGAGHGPYQIDFIAHPDVSVQQANDPVWSTDFMYRQGVAQAVAAQGTLWTSDTRNAIINAAMAVERPKYDYRQSRTTSDIENSLAFAQGSNPTAVANPTSPSSSAVGFLSNPFGGVVSTVTNRDTLLRTALVLVGLAIAAIAVARIGASTLD